MRGMDDVRAWFDQPFIGSCETAAAPFWRLFERFAPGLRIVIVRRHVDDVVESLMNIDGISFERAALTKNMEGLDRKLDQIEARVPGVLSVDFDDLNHEGVCARVFEHCLHRDHDHGHWATLADENIQINMPALMRYAQAYEPALRRLGKIAKQQTLADMAVRRPVAPDGISFQSEPFDDWIRDAQSLFDQHLAVVGEEPGTWRKKNVPLMRRLYDIGAMQIMTARSNGRMFGYLMTLVAPSLTSESVLTGSNTTFFASPLFPGLGMKIQRAALRALKERGVSEVFFEAGKRGDGERLGTMYRRLGAADHGHVYRLDLGEVGWA